MTDIKAFVGHSFEEDDDPIVRIFLEYFDEVQKMGLGFSWDHAKAAEPKDLAEKVLAKIQDKNLFIAICTRKERAVAANDLRRSVLPWRSLAAAETSFTWKASDWITQEIGLAIGRGMALMIAYRYSQENLEGVALFHYLNIHYSDRESGTWNNLGVQFNHFDLAGRAVEAFRKAEDLGETLAMSNLAFNFIRGGFFREAEDICNKAMGIKNCDKRVNQAITRLKELPDEETKKEEEIISKARPLSEFFRAFGHALLQFEPPDQEGRWQGPDCELKLTVKNGTFSAVGEYEWRNSGLGLFNAPVGLRTAALPPTVKRFRIVYEGSVQGRTIKGTVRREEIGKPVAVPTLLGNTDNEASVLLVVSDSTRKVAVYERRKGNDPKLYGLDHIG